MTFKIETLRCFCAVARAGKLSDAARKLGRTQSAISMTLKQFEHTLGGALFETERKNRLTKLGEQVLLLAESQIAQFDKTVQAMETLASAPRGVLRIAAVPSVAAFAFPPVVRHLTTQHPGVKIELRDADTQQVFDALLQGWADIGITSAKRNLNGVTATALFREPFGLVLSETHALANRAGPITIRDVFAARFLRNGLCDQIDNPEVLDRLADVDVNMRNTQSLLAMLLEGDWVTLLPCSAARLVGTGLTFRRISDLPAHREVFLYQRTEPSSARIVGDATDVIRALNWPGYD